MRWIFFSKCCSFCALLLVVVSPAQAAGHAAEPAHVSSSSHKDFGHQLNRLMGKPLDAALFTFSNALGVPLSITDSYFEGALPALFSRSVDHSAAVMNTLSVPRILPCAQVIACRSTAPEGASVVQSAQHLDLIESAEYRVNQSTAVPFSAAVWLFSCALFGFVMVANRRKA